MNETLKVAVQTDDFCLFFNYGNDFLCYSKGEWFSFLQAVAAFFAILISAWISRSIFSKQVKHANDINLRSAISKDFEMACDQINLCEFLKFSNENARKLISLINNILEDNEGEIIRPSEVKIIFDGILRNLGSIETIKAVEANCYKEFSQLSDNLNKFLPLLECIKTHEAGFKFEIDRYTIISPDEIISSINISIASLNAKIDQLNRSRNVFLSRRESLDKKIFKFEENYHPCLLCNKVIKIFVALIAAFCLRKSVD